MRAFRAGRDAAAAKAALDALFTASGTAENLVPRVLAAIEAKATLGEVMATLERRFGVYRP